MSTVETLSELVEVDALAIARITKDLKLSAETMSSNEARCIIDAYYQVQKYRKSAGNQLFAGNSSRAENVDDSAAFPVIEWYASHLAALEKRLQNLLKVYAEKTVVGNWSLSICGIGPVISAGLLAYIDIEKAEYAGNIWSYAGLNPTVTWNKGEKRPWNARLKTLCWSIGECFVKVQNNDKDFYGSMFVQRKAIEASKNEAGEFAAQAQTILETKNFKKSEEEERDFLRAVDWYEKGMLPPAHIHARAKRWTVKLFLSHWHQVAYYNHYKRLPAQPFVIEHLGHRDIIEVPNWHLVEETMQS